MAHASFPSRRENLRSSIRSRNEATARVCSRGSLFSTNDQYAMQLPRRHLTSADRLSDITQMSLYRRREDLVRALGAREGVWGCQGRVVAVGPRAWQAPAPFVSQTSAPRPCAAARRTRSASLEGCLVRPALAACRVCPALNWRAACGPGHPLQSRTSPLKGADGNGARDHHVGAAPR